MGLTGIGLGRAEQGGAGLGRAEQGGRRGGWARARRAGARRLRSPGLRGSGRGASRCHATG